MVRTSTEIRGAGQRRVYLLVIVGVFALILAFAVAGVEFALAVPHNAH